MKKVMVLFLAIIISLCAVSSAFAAKWVEVLRDNYYLISVDKSSLQYNGTTILVWEKWIPRNEDEIKQLSKGFKKKVAFTLDYREYDVNNRTYRGLATTYYDKNGNVISSSGDTYKTNIIRPDTVGDYLFNLYKKALGIK